MDNNTIAINILLGVDDPGASFPDDTYLRQYRFCIHDVPNQNNKIYIRRFLSRLKQLHLQPTEPAMDLLVIASAVYTADTRVNRYKTAQDSWTRRLKLFIPVSDVPLWNQQANLLQEAIAFLTGDIWHFEFRQRVPSVASIAPRPSRRSTGLSYAANTVCLFSGGMDSFIGAYDLLNRGERPLLIGHSKSKDVASFRNIAFESLKQRFPQQHIELIKAPISVGKVPNVTDREDTERGRSFLFLALGIVTASSLPISPEETRKVIVPENGLISINLPLTPLRLGAYSTRTTHPTFLNMMQALARALNFQIEIENPYEFKTKGEMLLETGAPQYIASVNTMSCSRPATRNADLEGAGERHCGTCVPCLIRRAALQRAGIVDDNQLLPQERRYRFDVLQMAVSASGNKGKNVMAFKYFINKIVRTPEYLVAAIRMNGPLNDVSRSVEMYQRGIAEVDTLLQNVSIIA